MGTLLTCWGRFPSSGCLRPNCNAVQTNNGCRWWLLLPLTVFVSKSWIADPADTRRWLGKLEVSDQALFHKILNGTHFTQDGKHYCQESDSDICPFCDCTDGRFHRFWICPQFEHHRRHVTPEVFQAVHCLPEALTCSGWSLAPSTQQQWDQYFVSLAPTPVPCWTFDGPLNVFTDGSCHGQHRAQTRFAGWAVVLAATEAVHDYTGSQVLDSGSCLAICRVQSVRRFTLSCVHCRLHVSMLVKWWSGATALQLSSAWDGCSQVMTSSRTALTLTCGR